MNKDPIYGRPGDSPAHLLELMGAILLRQIPIIDESRRIVGLKTWDDLSLSSRPRDNWVVLMAGARATGCGR